MDKPHS